MSESLHELPKYHETFTPILEILNSGKTLHYNDLRKKVRDQYYSNLPEELLNQKTSTGANTLLDRIGWGKSYLKQGKFLDYPERGIVQITEKGRNILQKKGSLSLDDLHNDEDFLAHRKLKKMEKSLKSNDIETDNSSPQDLIDSGFRLIETQIKGEILERLKVVDPYYFEKIILVLLKKMGYGDFVETSKSGDGGIDGIINRDQLGVEKIYIQAKRYNENKVREKDIRNFIGAMSGDTDKGVFVTTSSFDDLAVAKAREARHTIILIDGEKMADLMYEYKVGVQTQSTYEVKVIDEDFFEEN